MTSLVVVALLFAALFVFNYITKRRFGVLGLALAAGSLLAMNWTGTLTPFIEQQGVTMIAPPLAIVVGASLTLLPALVLLFSGPTYNKTLFRILGSLGFAMLALAFLTPSLKAALRLDGPGLAIYDFLNQYQSLVIVIGLVAALVDVVLTKTPKEKDKKH